MSGDVVGSVLEVSVEGIPYRAAADTNITHILTKFENSKIPTSGKGMRKMVKRIPAMEGVTLITNPDEAATLKSFAEDPEDIKFSVTLADGTIYKGEGAMEVENRETEEGRTTVQFLPNDDWTKY
jgi:hypothetical protein